MSARLTWFFWAMLLSIIAGNAAVAGGKRDPRTCDDHAFRHCR